MRTPRERGNIVSIDEALCIVGVVSRRRKGEMALELFINGVGERKLVFLHIYGHKLRRWLHMEGRRW